eukprot:TRINITY_DN103837_c0_g1_i1.p1 TRINITY_DN103837_c0_g1~~TRINITY_DN103837_c0_g1_i1.p1  ORF type:complete len:823 (-),score=110.36 TRINITY_DN103837_c0_g1_i1:92-2560(-)
MDLGLETLPAQDDTKILKPKEVTEREKTHLAARFTKIVRDSGKLETHKAFAENMLKIATGELDDHRAAVQSILPDHEDNSLLHDQLYLLALLIRSRDDKRPLEKDWNKKLFVYLDKDCSGTIGPFEMMKICRIIGIKPKVVQESMRYLASRQSDPTFLAGAEEQEALLEIEAVDEVKGVGKESFARIMYILENYWSPRHYDNAPAPAKAKAKVNETEDEITVDLGDESAASGEPLERLSSSARTISQAATPGLPDAGRKASEGAAEATDSGTVEAPGAPGAETGSLGVSVTPRTISGIPVSSVLTEPQIDMPMPAPQPFSTSALCSCGADPSPRELAGPQLRVVTVLHKASSPVDRDGLAYLREHASESSILLRDVVLGIFAWLVLPVARAAGWKSSVVKAADHESVALCLLVYVNAVISFLHPFSYFERIQPLLLYLVFGALCIEDAEKKKARKEKVRQQGKADDERYGGWHPHIYLFEEGRCEPRESVSLDTVIKMLLVKAERVSGPQEDKSVLFNTRNCLAALFSLVPLTPLVWRYCFGVGHFDASLATAFPGRWYENILVVGTNWLTMLLLACRLADLLDILNSYIPKFQALSNLLDRYEAAGAGFDYWLPLRYPINIMSWSKIRSEFWEDSMKRIIGAQTFISMLLAAALIYLGMLWTRTVYLQLHDFTVSDAAMCSLSLLLLISLFAFIYNGTQLNDILQEDESRLRSAKYEFEELRTVYHQKTFDGIEKEPRLGDVLEGVQNVLGNQAAGTVLAQLQRTSSPISLFGYPLTAAFTNTVYGYASTIIFTILQKYGMDVEGKATDMWDDLGMDKLTS